MNASNNPIVIVAAKRTPFGSFGGSFKGLSATELAAHASLSALEQAPGSGQYIDHVIFGNVIQTANDAAYLARHVALKVNLSQSTPAVTTNRLCGSGFESLADAVRRLQLGEAAVILAGGTENMSQAPYVVRNARFGQKLGSTEFEDSLMAGLSDSFVKLPMALTAENLAEQFGISRAQCDQYAYQSQVKAQKATLAGEFAAEVSPVKTVERGKETEVSRDEHIRPEATLEGLQKLKPIFKKDGVITAGNASGMVDGAAALILTTFSTAKERGWTVLGEWLSSHVVGCDPKIMGIGPVPAIQGLHKKTQTSDKDISLYEINEAFAPQVLACQKELNIADEKLNVHGGAIAIGHPLGASGARLVAHLLYALKKRGGGLGCAAACIGGGQGMAVLLKV